MRSPVIAAATGRAGGGAGAVSLGSRVRDPRTLAGFAVSAVIVFFFVRTVHLDLGAIAAAIGAADLRYLLPAFAVYYAAFVLRGLRWRLLLRHAGLPAAVRLPGLGGLVEMIYRAWFVNCLVPAKLGDAYRGYLLTRRTGADLSRTLGTIVGERVADVLVLGVLLGGSGVALAGGAAAFGGTFGLVVALGLGLGAALAGGLVALRLGGARLIARVPVRFRDGAARFLTATLRTFRRDVQLPLYGLTALIWAGEGLRLYLVLAGFHLTGLPALGIFFTALAGSLLSTIPFTPGGLGAVEGTTVVILAAFGVAAPLAGAVAVVDRVISYWSNLVVGGLLFLVRRAP